MVCLDSIKLTQCSQVFNDLNETTHFKKHGEQLAAFVSTMQLVRYSRVKWYPGTLYTRIVAVKVDNQYQTWRPPDAKKKIASYAKTESFFVQKQLATCVVKLYVRNVLTTIIHILCFLYSWFTQTMKIFLQQIFQIYSIFNADLIYM